MANKIRGHALYTETHMLAWREDEDNGPTYRLCELVRVANGTLVKGLEDDGALAYIEFDNFAEAVTALQETSRY